MMPGCSCFTTDNPDRQRTLHLIPPNHVYPRYAPRPHARAQATNRSPLRLDDHPHPLVPSPLRPCRLRRQSLDRLAEVPPHRVCDPTQTTFRCPPPAPISRPCSNAPIASSRLCAPHSTTTLYLFLFHIRRASRPVRSFLFSSMSRLVSPRPVSSRFLVASTRTTGPTRSARLVYPTLSDCPTRGGDIASSEPLAEGRAWCEASPEME
jgi:hypothetical protein